MSRPFNDLRSTGLIWLVNRVVLHPRGFALTLTVDTGTDEVTGWDLIGNGTQVFTMDGVDEDAKFAEVEALFASLRGDTNATMLAMILKRLSSADQPSAPAVAAKPPPAPVAPKPTIVDAPRPADMPAALAEIAAQQADINDPDRPLTMTMSLTDVMSPRPKFTRASFAASYNGKGSPNAVDESEGLR